MYVVTVHFRFDPADRAEMRRRLAGQAAASLSAEPDCLEFEVSESMDEPGSFFLYERYADQLAFRQHLETDHFRAFDAEVAPRTRAKTVAAWSVVSPAS